MKKILTFILIIILATNINTFAIADEVFIPSQDIDYEKSLMEEKSNQIVIKFREDFNLLSTTDTLNKYSINKGDINEFGNSSKIVNVGNANIEDLIRQLEEDPSIEYVERNYLYKQSSIPNDTYYRYLWHIENIKTEGAWDQIKDSGNQVLVAVIDSGIDYTHKDLVNRIAPGGYNFLYDNTSIYDYDGHGTFVSGIIAAEANNDYGIAGLAGDSNIKILPLRVSNYEGVANSVDIAKAIDYSIDKKVDVINLSLGGPVYSDVFNDAIQRAINANIVVVASSGNDGNEGNKINYPAAYNGVISVGATDAFNNRADFSNYNSSVDIVAPGEKIFSTSTFNDFKVGSGTSFSTPMVSATVALLKSIDLSLSVSEITEILTTTAIDLASKGKDSYYGYGLLDMEEAVMKASKTSATVDEYIDYKYMNVEDDKVFKIEFDYNLLEDSLNGNIYTSLEKRGVTNNTDIELIIDEQNTKIVYVKPKVKWDKGYNYLFINDKVLSTDDRRHKSKLRITFYVPGTTRILSKD